MSDSTTNIMSIRELIDSAFGDPDMNVVNHKLIQTILFILARQLRVLERRVEVVVGHTLPIATSSKLNITEIKMHAMQKKIRRSSKDIEARVSTADGSDVDKTSKKLGDKSSLDKQSSSKSSEKSTRKASTQSKVISQKKSQDSNNLLDTVEEQREKILRVIHQRANSREEQDKSPTPMASLDSVEAKYEKLLVVERLPASEAEAIAAGAYGTQDGRGARHEDRTPRLSIVTQDQFDKLSAAVRELQTLHFPIATPGFPNNAQLMADLRKGASLTDAMAALQLSARLEAAENTLEQMLSLITEVARQTPGINLEALLAEVNAPVSSTTKAPTVSGKSEKTQKKSLKGASAQNIKPHSFGTHSVDSIEFTQIEELTLEVFDETQYKNRTTKPDLDAALKELYEDIIKHVTMITSASATNADKAFQKVNKLELKIEASLDLGNKMNNLEAIVSDYVEKINILDTGLSSQMTNYQEQLTQMQHDLESGLETMAEVLANTGGDFAAIAELNGQFNNLQLDIENTIHRQKDLKNYQNTLAMDLQALWKQIELLREIKSDRDEVADALRDKVGIGELNGFVSLLQFDAVRGDFEKRIGSAYNKFNSQEMVWQKAIDELLRELNEKCDWIHVTSLKDEIDMHLNKLKSRMLAIVEVVGEPRAAALTRQIHRDAACLSCATPAVMHLEEPGIVPALPELRASRPPTKGTEAQSKPKEDGDHGLCYPGLPIPHSRDQRLHVCKRYCGGSHTLLPNTISRAPPGMIISTALRTASTELGSSGKVSKKPCSRCNFPKTTNSELSEPAKAPATADDSIMSPADFFATAADLTLEPNGSVSVTPPPPNDEN